VRLEVDYGRENPSLLGPDRRVHVRWRRLARGSGYALVVLGGLSLLPPVQARAKAIAVLVEALGGSFPRPFAADVSRREVQIGGVTGDLYDPGGAAPAVVLVPGAAGRGRDDDRVIRVARALARARRVVFVPDLELFERRFEPVDVDRLVAATEALLADERVSGGVSMLGFSYGGSFALLAAADPRISAQVEQVATFGAYFDMRGVVQALTTGVSLVDGNRYPWDPHPDAARIVRRQATRAVPQSQRVLLRQALDEEIDRSKLPLQARAVVDVLENEDPHRTFELVERLPAETRDLLERFSPATVAGRIETPVLALHSTDDPAVPYGEAVRLAGAMPRARLMTVSVFRHVDFQSASLSDWLSAGDDLFTVWRFVSAMISAQE
jgi:pimeloyl-ACP methyl ester carboxylesterase